MRQETITRHNGTGLTAWLSGLTVERLHQLFLARPDVLRGPEPRDLAETADRLQRPGSLNAALERLPLPCLQTLEALAAFGRDGGTAGELAALLGADSGADNGAHSGVDAVLEQLGSYGLVWPGPGGRLRMNGNLRQAFGRPLGIGPALEELLTGTTSEEQRGILVTLGLRAAGNKASRQAALLEHHRDPDRLAALLGSAPPAARKVLEEHAHDESPGGQPFLVSVPPRPDAGTQWALERGLLFPARDWSGAPVMPAEVVLTLRGPDWHAPFTPTPPDIPLAPVTGEEVEREAAAAALAFAGHALPVLAECAARPPKKLKSGGIGVRELQRLGKAAQAGEPVVRLVLECAHAAGLLASDAGCVAVTGAYDGWSAAEPARQTAQLLRAWWTMPGTPTASRDEDGKPLPAVTGHGACQGCLRTRQGLLAAAAALPGGSGARDAEGLGRRLSWHLPTAEEQPQDDGSTPFGTVIREAELLGVLARGALSSLGSALLADDVEKLTACAERLLPSAARTARIGADLTAVVTGTPAAELATLLDGVAGREALGSASVWRFGPDSIRRALDTGRTPEEIERELAAVASGPLPQPLTYLIRDTARRHGRIRVTSALCVLHSEEPALLAEIAAHRKLAKLGLRRIAPTVLVAGEGAPNEVLAALRAEGYAPVAETADGTVRVAGAEPVRAPSVPRPRTSGPSARAPAPASRELAARLLSGPAELPKPDPMGPGKLPYGTDTEEIVDGTARELTLADSRQLAHAIDHGEAVTIEYVSGSGAVTVRTLSDMELDYPYLYAWCHLREDERVFALSRIRSAMPPEQ